MPRWVLPLAAGLAAGCAADRPMHPPLAPPHLPAGPRVVAPPDVSSLPDALPPPAAPAADHLHLTAEQCRALACEHASAANLILAAAKDDGRALGAEAAELRAALARRLAQEARSRSAGTALDLYYRLLEAELLADVLSEAGAEVDDLVRTAEGFRERGFADGTELARLRKQQTELRADLLRAQGGGRRLNAELKALIGLGGCPGTLLPTDRLTVTPDRLDPDAAVQLALAHRADLQGLRELDARLTPKTVRPARQAVAALVPAVQPVAAVAPGAGAVLAHFLPRLLDDEVEAARELVRSALRQRALDADKEVRSAVDEWQSQQALVTLAKHQAAADDRRAAELAARRAGGAAVEADYRRAKLDAIQARANVVREAVKWKRADVAARQAMGLLCGDGPGGCP